METGLVVLLFMFVLINTFSFFLMMDDKMRSRKNDRRVSEGSLLFCAICFGALGVLAGMFVFRHKTLKMIFIVGVPLSLFQNIAVIYLVYSSIIAQK